MRSQLLLQAMIGVGLLYFGAAICILFLLAVIAGIASDRKMDVTGKRSKIAGLAILILIIFTVLIRYAMAPQGNPMIN